MRNLPRLCSHRSGAALMLLLSSIFLFPTSTPLFLHLYSFHISSPPLFAFLFPLFFFFFFYTSLSLFWLQNASLSLYLDALLSPWFLSLYLTSFSFFFFFCWRTDLQKCSKIHQCCMVAAFWSAWWVTTQPQALMYKCVFYKHFIYM